jgi:disulfide bond formation protein DsbB
MPGNPRILNVVVVILAVIGLIAVLGVVGMTVMHVSMMHGVRSCSEAMRLWR